MISILINGTGFPFTRKQHTRVACGSLESNNARIVLPEKKKVAEHVA
jgi:hypothetical protein